MKRTIDWLYKGGDVLNALVRLTMITYKGHCIIEKTLTKHNIHTHPVKNTGYCSFKANDIQGLLRKLNPDKATGPGGIPTRVLGEQRRISQTS